MTYEYDPRFARTTRKLPPPERQRVSDAVTGVIRLFEQRQVSGGLGVKKLFSGEEVGAVFEARAGLALRVLFSVQQDLVTFLMVGDHDEVRRFIKSFR